MQVKEKILDKIPILSLKGNLLSEVDTEGMRERIYKFAQSNQKHVIIDLGGVIHINSSGIGMLVSFVTTMRKVGGDIKLVRINDNVRKVFSITKLDGVFDIYDEVDQALASCRFNLFQRMNSFDSLRNIQVRRAIKNSSC